MKKETENIAEIIAVGNEILLGDVVNTNATYLSEVLWEAGFEVHFHSVVPDDHKIMLQSFELAARRANVVLVTGGLGPTIDDFTLEVFANLKNVKLKLHPEYLKTLEERFERLGKPLTENQKEQVMLPESGTILKNDLGTAPGLYDTYLNSDFIFFPGVPRELKAMFENEAKALLNKKFPFKLFRSRVTLRCFGASEGSLDQKVRNILKQEIFKEVAVAFQVKLPEIWIKIRAEAENQVALEAKLDAAKSALYSVVGEYVISEKDEDLAEILVKKLTAYSKTLALAESCSGGYAAHWLTMVPGASKCLIESMVTYSNDAKMKRLGVQANTLKKYGAVSEAVVLEMVSGLLTTSGADYAIALTGIAGPEGGTQEKPVGTVYIAIQSKDFTWHKKFCFPLGRENFKKLAAATAFHKLMNLL